MKKLYFFIITLIGLWAMTAAQALTLTSIDFTDQGKIPPQFSCKGDDISPTLTWSRAPKGTQSFALVVEDPDAPMGTWVHWVVYNIPVSAQGFAQNSQLGIGGTNSWGKQNYGGPCPPSGVHRYIFTLYALDAQLTFSKPPSSKELKEAMKPHVLESATLTGLFP